MQPQTSMDKSDGHAHARTVRTGAWPVEVPIGAAELLDWGGVAGNPIFCVIRKHF